MDHVGARELMVVRQIEGRGVVDPAVLAAMRLVPRERFVPGRFQAFAHADRPLPIGEAQTISQPYVVALMVEAAGVGPGDRVLEIGTGSGYAAAVLSRIAARVFTIERHEVLAEQARATLAGLGYANIELRTGDGTLGWPEAAPFDAILASAGGPVVPASWQDQLAIGGRLVMPVGPRLGQRLMKLVRTGADDWAEEDLGDVAFVPLVGAQGWQDG